MFTYVRKVGTTDVSVILRVIVSTDGTPEAAFAYNTAGIDLVYRREGATVTDITEATLAGADAAHSDGGVIYLHDGYIRVDLPDAACASGATGVLVSGSATGMVIIGCYIQLVAYDPFDTVRLGLTALPNAAADAAGGLPISDAGGLDLDAQIGTDINAILVDTGTTLDGKIDTIDGIVDTIVARVVGTLAAGTHNPQTGDAYARLGAPAGASVSADVAAVKAQTAAIEADTQDLQTQVGVDGAGLTALPWAAAWDAEVQSEVQDAIEANHLDHLLAADYDPAAKPGSATALLNELVENDGGVSRFTVNALENAPSGSGASAAAIADAVWDEAQADHVAVGSFGVMASEVADILVDTGTTLDGKLVGTIAAGTHNPQTGDAFARLGAPAGASVSADVAAVKAQTAAIEADTQDLQTQVGVDGAGLTAMPWNAAWDAEVQSEATDALNAYDPPTLAEIPTAAAIADQVWDEAAAGHVAAGSMGEEQQAHALSTEIAALNDLSSADVSAAVLAAVVEGTLTVQEALMLSTALAAGKSNGGGTATINLRNQADTLNRITLTKDANGNTTAVTLNLA